MPVILHFEILDFKRSPAQFHESLDKLPALQDCRQSLLHVGMPITVSDDAKLFVLPWQAPFVLDHLQESEIRFDDGKGVSVADLKPRHIVCSAAYRDDVDRAVAGCHRRCRDNVKVKRSAQIVLFL